MRTGNELGELSEARIRYSRARTAARVALRNELHHTTAIDTEDLLRSAGSCDGLVQSRITHRRLAARALVAHGISYDELAAGWGMSVGEVRDLALAPLTDPENRWPAIDKELREQHRLEELEQLPDEPARK